MNNKIELIITAIFTILAIFFIAMQNVGVFVYLIFFYILSIIIIKLLKSILKNHNELLVAINESPFIIKVLLVLLTVTFIYETFSGAHYGMFYIVMLILSIAMFFSWLKDGE